MVMIPDYFRGEYCKGLLWLIWYGKSFCKSQTVLSKISKDYEDFILPYAKNNGAQEIGLVFITEVPKSTRVRAQRISKS